MFSRFIALIAIAIIGTAGLSSCANTIRGVGRDAANTVDATQDAGRSVRHSAQPRRY